jgi:hypothetical protein
MTEHPLNDQAAKKPPREEGMKKLRDGDLIAKRAAKKARNDQLKEISKVGAELLAEQRAAINEDIVPYNDLEPWQEEDIVPYNDLEPWQEEYYAYVSECESED